MLDRRRWLGGLAGALLGSGRRAAADPPEESVRPSAANLEEIRQRLRDVGVRPVSELRSPHFQAIGNATERFIRLVLIESERLAANLLGHLRGRGFRLRMPESRLILVVFQDDRSFGKYFKLPTLLEAAETGQPIPPAGIYNRDDNTLNLFDWRNVPVAPRSASLNQQTLAHEATHLLSFNTGLLDRASDVPLAVVEGFGTYGETHGDSGSKGLGRVNLRRLVDLAKIQRRRPWIPLGELIAEDAGFRMGTADDVLLAYAQSWLLVHYLIQSEAALPGFQDYLEDLMQGKAHGDRRTAAAARLGDLHQLDRELRRFSIRLLRSS
jgi:hypothetical protein